MPRAWSHSRRLTPFVASVLVLASLGACSDSSSTTQPTAAGATVRFDRSGGDSHRRYVSPTGADVGTCSAKAPCRTINYAVGQANPGDEISVARGTYHETVHVTKRVSLEGHDATIDATGQSSPPNAVVISGADAAGTSIRGFTVQNAGLEGIFVNKTSHISVEKNTVVNNDAYGPFNPLCVNEADDCGEAVHLQTVTYSVVRDNLVKDNVGGILLTDEDGPTFGILIEHNRVLDNSKDCGITLASHHFDPVHPPTPDVAGIYHNVVRDNVANGNGAAGIGVFAGPPGASAWGNTVVQNTAIGNGEGGIMIHSHTPNQYVDRNVIVGNVIAKNGADVDNPYSDAPTGISIFSAVIPIPHTVVAENRISDEHYGINIDNAQVVSGLESNKFAKSVAVHVVRH
jgi:parallel beta helix pectate lyase-like protein